MSHRQAIHSGFWVFFVTVQAMALPIKCLFMKVHRKENQRNYSTFICVKFTKKNLWSVAAKHFLLSHSSKGKKKSFNFACFVMTVFKRLNQVKNV